jgi:hypothetical protein
MTKNTHSTGIRRRVRLGLAGLVSAFAVIGGTLGIAATPAFAATPLYFGVSVGIMVGGSATSFGVAGPDFSYTSTGQPMARNIGVYLYNLAPNSTASIAWRDETVGGSWQSGTSTTNEVAWSPGFYGASAVIEDIPSSTCGHTLQIEATGETGIWVPPALPNYSTLYPVTSSPASVVEHCGPSVWISGSSGGYATALAGDGFTPGGQVAISGTGPDLSHMFCYFRLGGRYCVTIPWSKTVTATTTRLGLHCVSGPLPGPHCWRYVTQAGGSISVALPKAVLPCGGADNVNIVDLSTNLAVSESLGDQCLT